MFSEGDIRHSHNFRRNCRDRPRICYDKAIKKKLEYLCGKYVIYRQIFNIKLINKFHETCLSVINFAIFKQHKIIIKIKKFMK